MWCRLIFALSQSQGAELTDATVDLDAKGIPSAAATAASTVRGVADIFGGDSTQDRFKPVMMWRTRGEGCGPTLLRRSSYCGTLVISKLVLHFVVLAEWLLHRRSSVIGGAKKVTGTGNYVFSDAECYDGVKFDDGVQSKVPALVFSKSWPSP